MNCELLAQVVKRKMTIFGHACRNNRCNFVKTFNLGMMPREIRRERPMLITSRTKKGTRKSLEETIRVTAGRTAGAANVRTYDAD